MGRVVLLDAPEVTAHQITADTGIGTTALGPGGGSYAVSHSRLLWAMADPVMNEVIQLRRELARVT